MSHSLQKPGTNSGQTLCQLMRERERDLILLQITKSRKEMKLCSKKTQNGPRYSFISTIPPEINGITLNSHCVNQFRHCEKGSETLRLFQIGLPSHQKWSGASRYRHPLQMITESNPGDLNMDFHHDIDLQEQLHSKLATLLPDLLSFLETRLC